MNTTQKQSPSRRRTKIVATVGPASRSPETLEQLIIGGVNVFRLNFSHGSHEEHAKTLNDIRTASKKLDIEVGILQDLSGPKIRITNVAGNYVEVFDGATIDLRYAGDAEKNEQLGSDSKTTVPLSTGQMLYVETIDPMDVLKPGHHVLLADGIIELKAKEIFPDRVLCTILKGGRLRSRVGIAFPDSVVNLPATTSKDLTDLAWGVKHGVDYAAISFVKDAADIQSLREAIAKQGGKVNIVAKIERRAAIENIDEILSVSDGLMVARGDLGLELPLEQVPLIQKRLIEQANYRGVPVIVATQMLHSMITSIRPTRAEVTDIAFAVMSGADAVMLSEETAIGEHPVHAVNYLGRIAQEAEQTFAFDEYKLRLRDSDRLTVSDAVAYAACAAAIKVNASALVACTTTGNSARLLAKYRPQQSLYGVSTEEETLRRMSLFWGVIPIRVTRTATHSDELTTAMAMVQTLERLPNGSRAVVTGGVSVSNPGSTSVLEIREFSSST